jgi:hypothetical protein
MILQRPHLFCNTFIPRYFLIATLWTLLLGNTCHATKFKLKVNVKTQIALYRVCDFIMSSVQFMYSGFPIQSTSHVSIGWTELTVSKSWRIYIHNPRLSLYTRNETRVHEFNKEINLNNSVTISLEKTKSCSYKYSLNNTTQLCPCCLPWI